MTNKTVDETLLNIENLRYRWRRGETDVLAIDRFAMNAGERVFLRGPSGSGKSTLLGVIGVGFKPQSRWVEILGQDLARMSGGGRDRFPAAHIGFVFHQFNLLPYLSVIDNVLLGGGFSRARRARLTSDPHKEAHRLVAELGLEREGVLDKAVMQLSVGQQQRVAVARALFGNPELVIADEPTSALDATAQAAFMDLLIRECRQSGAGLLFVSHDPSLAEGMDRVVDLGAINRAGRAAA